MNATSTRSYIIACGASAVIAGTTGWALRGPTEQPVVEAPPVAVAQPLQRAVEVRRDTAPVITVSRDGSVTLHVERQPLQWVLEQIAMQGGASAAASVRAPTPTICRDKPDAARLLQTIDQGNDTERFDGLMQARHASVFVPDEVLKTLYENDLSDRVRLAAFGIYLERYSGDPTTVRRTLEAALLVPSTAIQNDARQRLEEMLERERIDAASPQGASR